MATVTGNVALGLLTTEAESLLAQARQYREQMSKLPEGDPRKELYATIIRDLVDRATRISSTVTTTITSTSSSTGVK